jgi:hypothetical protein
MILDMMLLSTIRKGGKNGVQEELNINLVYKLIFRIIGNSQNNSIVLAFYTLIIYLRLIGIFARISFAIFDSWMKINIITVYC